VNRLAVIFVVGLTNVLITRLYATTIDFAVADLGGNKYEYAYTVKNDSLAFDINEFTVFFAFGLYRNLSVTTPVPDWSEITIDPDLILGNPIEGFYDALALTSGIAPGAIATGFSVSFDWLGAGIPVAQRFEVVDPVTLSVLDSGLTEIIPEPGTFGLLSLGLLTGIGVLRKHNGSDL